MKLSENTIFIRQLPKLVCLEFIHVTEKVSILYCTSLFITLILITWAKLLFLNSLPLLSDLKSIHIV